MAEHPPKRLTLAEVKAKVCECRSMAKDAIIPAHRVMLEHIAATWERIARNMETEQ